MADAGPASLALLDALRGENPRSVLVIGEGAVETAAQAFAAERADVELHAARDAEEIGARRYDVALVGGVIETWPEVRARALLAALRDRHCRAIVVLARAGAWPLTAYLALGFERLAEAAGGLELLHYHVDRWNPEREWNNPEHWANPENFKRYRW